MLAKPVGFDKAGGFALRPRAAAVKLYPSMAELLFKTVSYKLRKLVEDIAIGEIGLPDIQRPFVWPPTNRLINQAANFALVEWSDNLAIGDRPPGAYVPGLEARFDPAELERMYELHALWPGWYGMDYPAFLEERRRRMAGVIRRGFRALAG